MRNTKWPFCDVHVRRANFTTKSRFRTNFFEFALSVRYYSFQLYCNGNSFMQKLSNFPISKRGLMVKFARLTSTCKTEIQHETEDAYDAGLLTVILYVLHLFCDDFACGGLILLQCFVQSNGILIHSIVKICSIQRWLQKKRHT